VIVESEEGVGSAFGFRIPFELASLDVEVKPVEITHTNVRYLNSLSFVLIPLGNAYYISPPILIILTVLYNCLTVQQDEFTSYFYISL
jgi:hypothetical protein